jgi:alpha-L-fucosidase 2
LAFAQKNVAVCMLAVFTMVLGQDRASASAWKDGRMQVDVAGVVGRSDIVLERSNLANDEALPLGNGRLGIAVWSQDGFTAQLNRVDTLPRRYSPGQVCIPGIAALTGAADYRARLNLYDGTFEEHGGGMSLKAYVQPDADMLVIDVAGADPGKTQTARLQLWEPRKPAASAHGSLAMLAESWIDNEEPGSSGLAFGSLAAITAEGRGVSASVTDARTVTISFRPLADGRFRIFVASPGYKGGAPSALRPLLAEMLSHRDPVSHAAWWHTFWHRADWFKVTSQDGSGEYMENLRALYLYSAAAESGGKFPGSQAGEADLFSGAKDERQWDPAAFWHWNLRMQVAANLGAGLPDLNQSYFRLYRDNLSNMETWTREHMRGAPGICIPETMRFNGNGMEFERWDGNTSKVNGWNCDAASAPYYNARTLTTGAEVSLWIWEQYLATGDRKFLEENFPIMAESARFLVSYERPGADGLLHTAPSNAHETQWDVTDPITDLAARGALYRAVIAGSRVIGKESALAAELNVELTKIPSWPRAGVKAPQVLIGTGDAAGGDQILAESYVPRAPIHNVENIGLEPVWPYDRIGDTSPDFALARQTYFARPNKYQPDWSFDGVDAARLGLGDEVRRALVAITSRYQTYINGFNSFGGQNGEFYAEQSAQVALALQEALVQDYDGTIRIAPAVPADWDFDGSVSVRGGTRVEVQTRKGTAIAVGLEVKSAQQIRLRNPWPGREVWVTVAASGKGLPVVTSGDLIEFAALAGVTYRVDYVGDGGHEGFAPIGGVPAAAPKHLGPVHIGLARNAS